jgi:diguanylate cyclase (GGDEF)-like protein
MSTSLTADSILNVWSLLLVLITSFIAGFIVYRKVKSSALAEKKAVEEEFKHALELAKSSSRGLQQKVQVLSQQIERHLHFLVRLPEAVKNINTVLSFDDLIAACMRLVKEMIDTDETEIYLYSRSKNSMRLIRAVGSRRGEKIEYKMGEGIIGIAAKNRITITREILKNAWPEPIEMAAPMIFRKDLLGVIGIGKVKSPTGNEKRFLSMIADMTAVALYNLESFNVIKNEAIRDPLTGLYNRKYFLEVARESLQKASSYNFPLSVFIFDIDNFKTYNDTHGHLSGDELILKLGAILRQNTRSTNVIARYGGDEFIVLLNETEKEDGLIFAEKWKKLIESHPFKGEGAEALPVTISGGLASFPSDGQTVEELIKKADLALYESKRAGRDRITGYNPAGMSSCPGPKPIQQNQTYIDAKEKP